MLKDMIKQGVLEALRSPEGKALFAEAFREALKRDVMMRHAKDGREEVRTMDMLQLVIERLQWAESRDLGIQEDLESLRNTEAALTEKHELILRTLLGLERPISRVVVLADAVAPALEAGRAKTVEALPNG